MVFNRYDDGFISRERELNQGNCELTSFYNAPREIREIKVQEKGPKWLFQNLQLETNLCWGGVEGVCLGDQLIYKYNKKVLKAKSLNHIFLSYTGISSKIIIWIHSISL